MNIARYMNMKTLTITTCQTYPNPSDNLTTLAETLCAMGIECQIQPWQHVQKSEAILPLAAWDYAAEPEHFRHWIQRLVQQGSRFINSAELMLWNMHKSYLCDLQHRGIRVIPTVYLAAEPTQIRQTIAQQGWQDVVFKPAIGQSGKAVVKHRQGEPLPDLSPYAQGLIIQPYIAEVATNGETSLIFFNGEFSHAVRRQPKAGDFRANSAYGVTVNSIAPPTQIIRLARQVLAALPDMPVYARIDGTVIGDDFLLNELELIEPALYLHTNAQATQQFAEVLKMR